MDWVRKNKFLAGYLAALIIGLGAAGFFLYSTYSRYDQVSQEYNSQSTELKRLQNLKPYPEEANLTRFSTQKAAFGQAVISLQDDLAKMSAPVTPALSPTDFQNRLREIVADVSHSASDAGVGLPDGFYLGFEQYRQTLPDASATPYLTTQLTEVEQIVRTLIDRKIDKITSIKRAPLPGESGQLIGANSGDKPKAPGGNELVTRHSVEIAFSAAPSSFRESLAKITQASRLFVVRALQVKNQSDQGPVRGQESAIPGGSGRPSAAPPAPGDQPLPEKGPPPLRYVVGQEKLDVIMHLELIHILEPAK